MFESDLTQTKQYYTDMKVGLGLENLTFFLCSYKHNCTKDPMPYLGLILRASDLARVI